MKHICINKDGVIENFMNLCEFVKNDYIYQVSEFGFYFDDEHLDLELLHGYKILDKVIEYIKNKSLDSLIYYYFIIYDSYDIEYVYSKYDKYKNTFVNNTYSNLQTWSSVYDSGNIVLNIDKGFYDDED